MTRWLLCGEESYEATFAIGRPYISGVGSRRRFLTSFGCPTGYLRGCLHYPGQAGQRAAPGGRGGGDTDRGCTIDGVVLGSWRIPFSSSASIDSSKQELHEEATSVTATLTIFITEAGQLIGKLRGDGCGGFKEGLPMSTKTTECYCKE